MTYFILYCAYYITFQFEFYYVHGNVLFNMTVCLSFSDINECTSDNNCDANAHCENIDGSFICKCNAGYSGDGVSCQGKY